MFIPFNDNFRIDKRDYRVKRHEEFLAELEENRGVRDSRLYLGPGDFSSYPLSSPVSKKRPLIEEYKPLQLEREEYVGKPLDEISIKTRRGSSTVDVSCKYAVPFILVFLELVS
jgi:hypothetical protein